MAKKTLCLDTPLAASRSRLVTNVTPAGLVSRVMSWLETRQWVCRLSALYADLLEEPVAPRRTLRFVYAQAALAAALFPADLSLALRTLLLVWAALAVWQCRRR